MSTYADFITKLRADTGDFGIRRYETADGDGATSVFQLAHPKILESSYTIKVSSVAQTETTAYTINKDTGQIVFVTASIPAAGNDTVSFEYQSVNLLDADWIDIVNQVLSELRTKLWKELTDESTLTTVADQVDYATSGIAADIVHLLNIEYRVSSSDSWRSVRSVTNVVFYKDLQKIHMRPAFDVNSYALRIRVNRAYVQGTATSSTFEPQEKYWSVIRKYCAVKYLERRVLEMLKETGAVSKEKAFENAVEMTKLATVWRQQADEMLKRIRPSKPALEIPHKILGVNA